MHVLLTKADKLKRDAAAKALTQVRRELGEAATVQLFSAVKSQGLDAARNRLQEFMVGEQKEASDAEYRGTSEANSTGLG